MTTFDEMLKAGYGFTDAAVTLGAALEAGGTVHPEPKVRIPLAMMNRHGLIAGATGTGRPRRSSSSPSSCRRRAFPSSWPTSRAT